MNQQTIPRNPMERVQLRLQAQVDQALLLRQAQQQALRKAARRSQWRQRWLSWQGASVGLLGGVILWAGIHLAVQVSGYIPLESQAPASFAPMPAGYQSMPGQPAVYVPQSPAPPAQASR